MCSSVSMYRSFLLASGLVLMGCGPTSDDTASEVVIGAGWARFDTLGTLAWLDGQAYLCGVDESVSDSRWFGEDGGAWADTSGSWSFTVADGTVELEGPEASLSGAAYALDEGALYDTTEDCRPGAILTEDGFVGAWCNDDGQHFQVEPIETIMGVPATIRVRLVDDPSVEFEFVQVP